MQPRQSRQKVVMLTPSAKVFAGVKPRQGRVLHRPVGTDASTLWCLRRFFHHVALADGKMHVLTPLSIATFCRRCRFLCAWGCSVSGTSCTQPAGLTKLPAHMFMAFVSLAARQRCHSEVVVTARACHCALIIEVMAWSSNDGYRRRSNGQGSQEVRALSAPAEAQGALPVVPQVCM